MFRLLLACLACLVLSLLLIPPKRSHDPPHLLLPIDPKSLISSHTSQLYVLRIQFLLHDLLQGLQNQSLSFGQCKRTVVLGLEFRLGAFATGSDGFRVVAVEGTGRFGVVSTNSSLVKPNSPYPSLGPLYISFERRGGYSCGPSSSYPAISKATPKGLLITLSSPSAPSPNLSAKSQIACVQLSTRRGSA